MDVPRILLPGFTAEQWDEQSAKLGRVEMFPADEWDKYLEAKAMTTTRENIIASATEGASAPQAQEMSDIEKAARAIVISLGFDPDRLAIAYNPERGPKGSWFLPAAETAAPIWTFFDREAEAALASVSR